MRMFASGALAVLLAVLGFSNVAHAQTPAPVELPSGWFGVKISDEGMFDDHGRAFFDGYPVVNRVEPESPASRAGVKPGDVLMSFNSHDMRGTAIELRRWLKPGAPFVLRLKRNGEIRTVRGTLGKRPEGWLDTIAVVVTGEAGFEHRPLLRSREPLPATSGVGPRTVIVRTPMPAGLPPALILGAFTFGGGLYPFAGAEFTALNEDLSAALGVKPEGIFVTNVVEGSPARISGLRGGDVVVMADSIRLDNPVDLVRAIRESEDRSIRLEILRKRKPQTLTLRW